MKIKTAVVIMSVLPLVSLAHRPDMNLTQLKHQIVSYHESGQYNSDVNKVAAKAMKYLQQRVKQNEKLKHPKKLAIVLDIDETSLSNFSAMKSVDFSSVSLKGHQAHDPAIIPTLKIYKFAKKHKVAIFFITGRYEKERDMTSKSLQDAGYTDWTHLYLKPDNYHHKSAVHFKASTRKAIKKLGYDIVLNVGDQKSDLAGGYAEKVYQYPDNMYYVP